MICPVIRVKRACQNIAYPCKPKVSSQGPGRCLEVVVHLPDGNDRTCCETAVQQVSQDGWIHCRRLFAGGALVSCPGSRADTGHMQFVLDVNQIHHSWWHPAFQSGGAQILASVHPGGAGPLVTRHLDSLTVATCHPILRILSSLRFANRLRYGSGI